MLGLRPVDPNIQNQDGGFKKPKVLANAKTTTVIKTLKGENKIIHTPRPLKPSNKQAEFIKPKLNAQSSQKVRPKQQQQQQKQQPKSDENDISQFIKEAYNPLDAIYSFDEELCEKVRKLELADDGFPPIEAPSEPFDF